MKLDEKFDFDDEKKKRAIEWIEQNCPNLKCECCNTADWQLAQHFVTPTIYSDGLIIGGPTYPSFMIICKKCANTKIFNAVSSQVLRIAGGERKPEKEEEENAKASS